jgi:hypothetical protein
MGNSNRNEPTLAAWEQGLPLREALVKFSNQASLAAEYQELSSYIFPKLLPPADLPQKYNWSPQPPLHYDPSTLYPRFRGVEELLQRRITDRIISRELLVLRRRKVGHPPELVPVCLWQTGRISRDESELWTATDAFEFRLIETPEASTAAIMAAIPAVEPLRKRGPSSNSRWIIQAYDELLTHHKIEFSRSFEANIPRIRSVAQCLRAGDPNARGFGHSSIANALSKRFQQDKEAGGISKESSKD